MKKISILLACIMFCISVCAYASADENITNMTSDELLRLEEQIQSELAKRGANNLKLLPAGTYVVGKDIAEGNYLVHFMPGSISGLEIEFFKVGLSSDEYNSDNWALPRIWINNTQGDGSLNLTEGLVVVVSYIGDGYGTIEKVNGLFMD